MANNSLKFVVEVAADQATGALNAISTAVNQAGVKMKATMLGVGEAGRAAGAGSSSLERSVKSLKAEMMAGDRTINYFANALNGIVPASSIAGQGIRLLADGIIGGVGLGFALQIAMTGLQLLGEHLAESKKQAEEAARAIRDIRAAWDDLLLQRSGASQATSLLIRQAKAIDQDETVVRLTKERTEALKRLQSQQDLMSMGETSKYELEAAQREVEQIEKRIRDRREELFGVIANNARAALRSEAQEATNKREREAAGNSKKVDEENTERIKKEEKATKALTTSLDDLYQSRQALFEMEVEWEAIRNNRSRANGADLNQAQVPGTGIIPFGSKQDEEDAKRIAAARQAGQEIGDAYVQPMVATFTQGLSYMLQGQMTFRDLVTSIWQEILNLVIQTIGQMVASWMTSKVTERFVDSASSVAKVSHAAGVAGANAYASQAGIPIAGPALGAAAMAQTVSTILSTMMPLASARAGWDVPNLSGDIPAVLHKREMVLPERLADNVRRGAAGGGINIAISGAIVDGRSIEKVVTSEPFQRNMRRATRRQG